MSAKRDILDQIRVGEKLKEDITPDVVIEEDQRIAEMTSALQAMQELIDTSLAPALALLPSSVKRGIQAKADAVKEAIECIET